MRARNRGARARTCRSVNGPPRAGTDSATLKCACTVAALEGHSCGGVVRQLCPRARDGAGVLGPCNAAAAPVGGALCHARGAQRQDAIRLALEAYRRSQAVVRTAKVSAPEFDPLRHLVMYNYATGRTSRQVQADKKKDRKTCDTAALTILEGPHRAPSARLIVYVRRGCWGARGAAAASAPATAAHAPPMVAPCGCVRVGKGALLWCLRLHVRAVQTRIAGRPARARVQKTRLLAACRHACVCVCVCACACVRVSDRVHMHACVCVLVRAFFRRRTRL